MAGVFLSYRHNDGGWSGRIQDHLEVRFGEKLVWRDAERLQPGEEYLTKILKVIESADAVLIIIGPYWIKEGRRRLKDTTDVLRMEITHALNTKREVIPVLVGGAKMPPDKALPRGLARLREHQAAIISEGTWDYDIQRLIERLQRVLHAKGERVPLKELYDKLEAMQSRYFLLVDEERHEQALNFARRALKLLDEKMPSYPNDPILQLLKGYFLKDEAAALLQLGDAAALESSLEKAERIFKTMIRESELGMANSYNGLGSVEYLKGNFEKSLLLIDKALELNPSHEYALQDRQVVLNTLRKTRQGRRH